MSVHAAIAERAARGRWTAFTPTWNGVTIGNATNVGTYRYVQGDLLVVVHMILGSTTAFTGNVSFDLPDGAVCKATSTHINFQGVGNLKDSGADAVGHCQIGDGATAVVCLSATNNVTSANPFTWTTGDDLMMQIVLGVV